MSWLTPVRLTATICPVEPDVWTTAIGPCDFGTARASIRSAWMQSSARVSRRFGRN